MIVSVEGGGSRSDRRKLTVGKALKGMSLEELQLFQEYLRASLNIADEVSYDAFQRHLAEWKARKSSK